MSIKFAYVHRIHLRTTYLSLIAFSAWPSLQIHTPPLFQVEMEKDGWE